MNDIFDYVNDPACELDRLRDEIAKLKAALVHAEAERAAVLDSLNALAYLAHGVSESLATAAQSLAPGAPSPSMPVKLALDLAAMPRDQRGQVIPLHSTTAPADPPAEADHQPNPA